jgi:hypothetical protein
MSSAHCTAVPAPARSLATPGGWAWATFCMPRALTAARLSALNGPAPHDRGSDWRGTSSGHECANNPLRWAAIPGVDVDAGDVGDPESSGEQRGAVAGAGADVQDGGPLGEPGAAVHVQDQARHRRGGGGPPVVPGAWPGVVGVGGPDPGYQRLGAVVGRVQPSRLIRRSVPRRSPVRRAGVAVVVRPASRRGRRLADVAVTVRRAGVRVTGVA